MIPWDILEKFLVEFEDACAAPFKLRSADCAFLDVFLRLLPALSACLSILSKPLAVTLKSSEPPLVFFPAIYLPYYLALAFAFADSSACFCESLTRLFIEFEFSFSI